MHVIRLEPERKTCFAGRHGAGAGGVHAGRLVTVFAPPTPTAVFDGPRTRELHVLR